MKHCFIFHFLARLRALGCACALGLLLALNICPTSQAAEASASPPKWVPLADLIKKWADTPLEELKRVAEGGDVTAQHYLGYCFAQGFRFPEDLPAGIRWYERAANAGYVPSCNNLGLYYHRGLGRDRAKAFYYYRLAAEAGMAVAQCNLGMLYEQYYFEGPEPRPTLKHGDPVQAAQWYRRAAEQNFSGGQYRLGLLYLTGDGVAWDEERGLELVRAAADQDNALAKLKLSQLYTAGIGQPRNEQDRPLNLLLQAAAADCREAYWPVVFRYRHGLGTALDLPEAAAWHCRAALSDLSSTGRVLGPPRPPSPRFEDTFAAQSLRPDDPFPAVLSLYLKAVNQKEPGALLEIGNMYLTGQNAPKNPVKAWRWCTLASERGATGAGAKVAEAQASLKPDELQEARRLLPALVEELDRVAPAVQEIAKAPVTP